MHSLVLSTSKLQQQHTRTGLQPLRRSDWTILWDFAFSSPAPAPILPKSPCPEQRGSGLTVSASVGRFRSYPHKWGMASSAACECGAEEQTVDHVVLQSPIHRRPHGLHGLTVLDMGGGTFFKLEGHKCTLKRNYRIYSSITRTLNFLIENWCEFFSCCNILYYYIIEPKYCWNCKQGSLFTAHCIHRYHAVKR